MNIDIQASGEQGTRILIKELSRLKKGKMNLLPEQMCSKRNCEKKKFLG